MSGWSQTFTYLDGEWIEGNTPFIGARTHAFWLGSSVFDGARAFEGVTPDLDRHCARVNRSATTMGLRPVVSVEAMVEFAREGVRKFAPGAELYIRPMYWAERAGATGVQPDPQSTRFCLSIYDAPLPEPKGISITRSPYMKPLGATMPIDAKAGCLYPNNARALIEAQSRGFDNCLLCDMLGNVAELATANVFMAKDGVVLTPMANGTFLNGVTRQRVLQLSAGRGNGRARVDAGLFRISTRRTKSSSSATTARSPRPGGSTGATCSPGRSTAVRENSIGSSPIPDRKPAERPGGLMSTRLTIRLDFDGGPPAGRREDRAPGSDRPHRVDLRRGPGSRHVVPARVAPGRRTEPAVRRSAGRRPPRGNERGRRAIDR